MSISAKLMILNYNGLELLKECVPSALAAINASKFNCSLMVVDNNSTDKSASFLRKKYPQVEIFCANTNQYLYTYNSVIKQVSDGIVILLNNDITVKENFLNPLIQPFLEHENLFMTSPAFYNHNGQQLECGRTSAGIKWGFFWSAQMRDQTKKLVDVDGTTFSSGMGAIDRKKFMELDGFDSLYMPGTLEDTDLAFRAWQRGWKSLYVRTSNIYHKGQVSYRRAFGAKGIRIMNFRNTYLFLWKNIRDPFYLFQHVFFLIPTLLWALLKGQPERPLGFLQALKRLPTAIAHQSDRKKNISERTIFGHFTS